jgi:hypothetical protein
VLLWPGFEGFLNYDRCIWTFNDHKCGQWRSLKIISSDTLNQWCEHPLKSNAFQLDCKVQWLQQEDIAVYSTLVSALFAIASIHKNNRRYIFHCILLKNYLYISRKWLGLTDGFRSRQYVCSEPLVNRPTYNWLYMEGMHGMHAARRSSCSRNRSKKQRAYNVTLEQHRAFSRPSVQWVLGGRV